MTEVTFPKPEAVLGSRQVQLKGRGMGSPTLPVHSEVLKPKDVQETDGPSRVLHFQGRWLVDCCVDLLHNPHKEPPIDALKGTHQPQGKADPPRVAVTIPRHVGSGLQPYR